METKQTQFLRIFDEGATYYRWQNSYINQAVTWDGHLWAYQPFEADGITSGDASSESTLVVGVPATTLTDQAFRRALNNGHLVEVLQYEFEIEPDQPLVPISQRLIASYIGEVIGAKGRLTQIEIELGTALAPVGVQVPPRTFSSFLVGVPCQL